MQRFVEQKQLRLAEQRLREEQPLQLASRELAQRPRGERLRLDGRDDAVDLVVAARPARGSPQRSPSKRARHEIPATQAKVGDATRAAAADSRRRDCRAPASRPEPAVSPADGRSEPEDRVEQRRLARAVGTEHADELAGPYRRS